MISRAYILLFILSLPLLTSAIPISAQPEGALQIPALADAYIAEDEPGWKAGFDDYLIIGYSEYFSQYNCDFVPSGGYYEKKIVCTQKYEIKNKRNILVHFDLNQIPPGSEVTEAILRVHAYLPENNLPVAVYGLAECFKEGEVTWISRETAHAWRNSGGTYENMRIEYGTLGAFQRSAEFYTFNVTYYYRKVVRGEMENCGIIIVPEPNKSPGSKKVAVDTCSLLTGECQTIYREGFKDYILSKKEEHYAKFYSKELAQRDKRPEYIPTLIIKFIGPSIYLVPDNVGPLKAYPGENTSFNLLLNGTYLGNVTLSPEIPKKGISIKFEGQVKMGSSIRAVISVDKDAEPGDYPFKIIPAAKGYNASYFDIKGLSGVVTVEKKVTKLKDYFLMLPQYVKVNVSQGGSTSFKLNLVPRGKFWSKVRLSSSSPDWMTVSFDPEEGSPSFSSLVKVSVSKDAPLGQHDLILMAEGGNISRNVTIKVRVMKAQTQTQTTQQTAQQTTSSKVSTTVSKETSPTFSSSTQPQRTTTPTKAEGGPGITLLLSLVVAVVVIGVAVLLLKRRAA